MNSFSNLHRFGEEAPDFSWGMNCRKLYMLPLYFDVADV